jgi:hypothetical protein
MSDYLRDYLYNFNREREREQEADRRAEDLKKLEADCLAEERLNRE